LLSSNPSSLASSSILSSFRSGISIFMQIAPSVSHISSVFSTSYIQWSLRSYWYSPSITTSQSLADLRHMSSQRPLASLQVSPSQIALIHV
jgi:E3 ubiquitin-protein ligase RNF13